MERLKSLCVLIWVTSDLEGLYFICRNTSTVFFLFFFKFNLLLHAPLTDLKYSNSIIPFPIISHLLFYIPHKSISTLSLRLLTTTCPPYFTNLTTPFPNIHLTNLHVLLCLIQTSQLYVLLLLIHTSQLPVQLCLIQTSQIHVPLLLLHTSQFPVLLHTI